MPVDIEELRQISYFSILGPDELSRIATVTVERHFNRGDSILIEGEMGGALHYVRSGLVKVFKISPDGKEQVLRMVAAGYTFNDATCPPSMAAPILPMWQPWNPAQST